jgi:Do/DeqQ family serine protease
MKVLTKKTGKLALVAVSAILCFSLVAFFCSTNPGSAQTAYADTPSASGQSIPADSVALLEGMQKANRSVTQAILPSVVTLDVVETKTVANSPMNGFPWFFFGNPQGGDDGSGNGDDKSQQQREYKSEGLGSGVIVRKTGNLFYVLTNQHVAGASTDISIKLFDGREFKGKLVGGDERKDIALVSFESADNSIKVAKIGDSDTVQTGDIVFAVGSPLGYMSSVTQGIVSAVGRSGGPNNNINDFIQTDAAINQGNSGGPLVNIYGEVIGINSWIASQSGGSQGLGFSIPVNNVKKAIDDFIATGKIKYGWLGVSLMDADKETLDSLKIGDKKGALASQVFIGSPAEKGGMVPGDFVVSLNGKEVKTVDQLVRDVGDLESGQTAKFVIIRNGKEQTLSVKIEERNETTVTDSSKLWPGFMPYALNDDVIKQLKLDAKQKGVLVTNVQTKSAAAIMGLQSGDVITKVNDKDVAGLSDFYAKLADRSSKDIWFDVIREGQTVSTMRYKR